MSDQGTQTGVTVTMKFFFLAFLLLLFKPVLIVDDGAPTVQKWGSVFVPLAPGQHTLTVYCPYIIFRTMGKSSITVTVGSGQTSATWSAPLLVFLKGSWKQS